MIGQIEAVVEALNAAGVRYLIVGGVAVVLHGHLRTTADLDLVVQLERGNVLKALGALKALGYVPSAPVPAEEFADAAVRATWIRDKGMTVFALWSKQAPALGVDLFVSEPFDFARVYARALRIPLQKAEAMVVSIDDLIALKTKAARPRDMEDVAALKAISGEPDEKGPPRGGTRA